MTEGIIIYSDGTQRVVECEDIDLPKLLGGNIQKVEDNEGRIMAVNEDGMGLELPANEAAYALLHSKYKRPIGCTDQIFGNAFIYLA